MQPTPTCTRPLASAAFLTMPSRTGNFNSCPCTRTLLPLPSSLNTSPARVVLAVPQDEIAHVKFLRDALGEAAVDQPKLDLGPAFVAAADAVSGRLVIAACACAYAATACSASALSSRCSGSRYVCNGAAVPNGSHQGGDSVPISPPCNTTIPDLFLITTP